MRPLPEDFNLADLARALAHVPRFRVAVDGGAHRGIWAKRMAERFEHVWAFEPVRAHFEKLAELPVKAVNAALGDARGVAHMRAGTDNDGQYHISDAGEPCLVVKLDEYELDDVDFLKLDVEGYEYRALQGAEDTIRRCRPVVMIELNELEDRYDPRGACEAWLAERGYRSVEKMPHDRVYAC